MSKIIGDFVKSADGAGYGVFEGDEVAARHAKTMGKCQRRNWERHNVVPAAFLNYLVGVGAIEKCFIPEPERTVWKVLELLYDSPARNRGGESIGEVVRTALEKDLLPKVLLGSSEYIWDHAKVFGVKRN
ncbi:MAG: hypothetical protein C4576_13845 [Desulfobacteraceae bacterium]|nr:MAG: hypothetical protein C4576_13845 [Desulfobacteraceae bacterium]